MEENKERKARMQAIVDMCDIALKVIHEKEQVYRIEALRFFVNEGLRHMEIAEKEPQEAEERCKQAGYCWFAASCLRGNWKTKKDKQVF